MKKIISVLTLMCVTLGLTACNTELSNNNAETSNKFAINVSNDIASASTSYVNIQKPSVSSEPSEDVSPSGSDSTEQLPKTEDTLPLVPENGVLMNDSTALGEFIINGVAFNITEDLTANEMCERMEADFGNWGLGYDNYNNKRGFDDKIGYYFFGVGLGYPFGGDKVYVEAVDENGELVTKWRNMTDDGKPNFDGYSIKGIRFSKQTEPDFVHFIGGLEVGKQPEYYEELLGKGYEVENTDSDYEYRISIYKTSSVTMVIEYRENRDEWYNESITLIKN